MAHRHTKPLHQRASTRQVLRQQRLERERQAGAADTHTAHDADTEENATYGD